MELEIEKPTRESLLKVLRALVRGFVDREDVQDWQRKVLERFGEITPDGPHIPLTVRDGLWEFFSLGVLSTKSILAPTSDFIREQDIHEYVETLEQLDCDEALNDIHRIRAHQLSDDAGEIGYVMALKDPELFTRNQLSSVRGVFDDLGSLLETGIYKYGESHYILTMEHSRQPGLVILEGIKTGKERVISFLWELGVKSESIHWVSPEVDAAPCRLHRQDDNGNQVPMDQYPTFIQADLARREFEAHGHKQLYFVKGLR